MPDGSIPEFRVRVEQLVPGVFIRLENVSWLDHPFLLSSFLIKDAEQIAILKDIGVAEVICVPEKSRTLPRRRHETPETPAPAKPKEAPRSEAMQRLFEEKRARAKRLAKKRERIRVVEERFQQSLKDMANVMQSVVAGDTSSVEQATLFVDKMAAHFLSDMESTLHLMNVMDQVEQMYFHSLNVSVLAMMLGKEAGLDADELRILGMAALFHDIGKTRIEKKILRKVGPLTRAEVAVLQAHVVYARDILEPVTDFSRRAIDVIQEHHEHADGSGYPQGLTGAEILPLARMVIIANEFDNLCNRRDPADSLTPYQALSTMFSRNKELYDPEYLTLFIRCLGIYPPGTVVQLSNGTIGVVVSVNSAHQLAPSVLIYDPHIPKREALVVDLASGDGLGDGIGDGLGEGATGSTSGEGALRIEKSIRATQLPEEIYDYLSLRQRISYFVNPDDEG